MTRIMTIAGRRFVTDLHPVGSGYEWRNRGGCEGWFKGDEETVLAAVTRFLEGAYVKEKKA